MAPASPSAGPTELSLGLTPAEVGIGILTIAGIVWVFKNAYATVFGGGKN